jgi:hypothetical protein
VLRGIVLALIAGCGRAAPSTLSLGWRFADGRRCSDAGAATVTIGWDCEGCAAASFACADGDAAAPGAPTVMVAPPDGATRLLASAISSGGGTLYRGALDLGARLPSPAFVTLFFTGN